MRTPHNRDDKIEGKQIGEDHREIEFFTRRCGHALLLLAGLFAATRLERREPLRRYRALESGVPDALALWLPGFLEGDGSQHGCREHPPVR